MALTDLQPQIPLDPVAIGDLVTSPRSNANDIEFASIRQVTELPQISDSTYTADGNPVQITIDGALYAIGLAGDPIGTVVSTANAIVAFAAAGYVASNPAGTTLRITGPDGQAFTIVNTSATNLGAFATTQAAVDQPEIAAGYACYWDASPERNRSNYVRLPVSGGTFKGFALRRDLPSDTEAIALGNTVGRMIPGRAFMTADRFCTVKVHNRDTVSEGDQVFAIFDANSADRGQVTNSNGGTAGTLALTVTAGLAGEAVGGSIDGGPVVTLPGGSTTVDNTDAAQLLPLFAAAYAGLYTFIVAANVITATKVALDGVAPAFVDASGGAASIADVATAGTAADAELIPGCVFAGDADADAGADVILPQ